MKKKELSNLLKATIELRKGLECQIGRLIQLYGFLVAYNKSSAMKTNSEINIIIESNRRLLSNFSAEFEKLYGETTKDKVAFIKETVPELAPHLEHLQHASRECKVWIKKVDAIKAASEAHFKKTFARMQGIPVEELQRSPVTKKRGVYSRTGLLK